MSASKCRILCVDDHEDTCVMLTYLLGQEDYEVTPAGSIDEALRLVEHNTFDLYVLDKRFPDGTGVELCQRLFKLTPDVPIIFYSGDAYAVHRREGIEVGASAYIPKPQLEELITAVNSLLAEKQCASAV
jgi:CheY-like chemotaxis protein